MINKFLKQLSQFATLAILGASFTNIHAAESLMIDDQKERVEADVTDLTTRQKTHMQNYQEQYYNLLNSPVGITSYFVPITANNGSTAFNPETNIKTSMTIHKNSTLASIATIDALPINISYTYNLSSYTVEYGPNHKNESMRGVKIVLIPKHGTFPDVQKNLQVSDFKCYVDMPSEKMIMSFSGESSNDNKTINLLKYSDAKDDNADYLTNCERKKITINLFGQPDKEIIYPNNNLGITFTGI